MGLLRVSGSDVNPHAGKMLTVPWDRKPVIAVAVAVGAALTVLLPATFGAPAVQAVSSAQESPNVVLINTDDMRRDDLRYMPYTRRLFRRQGTTFTRVISPHPLCCPARGEMVSGQYAQNNGVHHNRGPYGALQALGTTERMLPQWFQREGYKTAFAGKFLNGYQGGDLPGLTFNDATSGMTYSATGFTSWNNGDPIQHEDIHQTDWVAQRTADWIGQWAGRPFFIWASQLAPHTMWQDGRWGPPVPAERHSTFKKEWHAVPPSTRKTSYNEAKIRDKPRWIRKRKRVRDEAVWERHRGRVLSLYGVDEAVRTTVRALKDAEVWSNTVLVFTSDNGVGMGAHRIISKNIPYQEAFRIPFLMLGPGVDKGAVDHRLGMLVDLPATLADLAGVTPRRVQDGVSLTTGPLRKAVLVQGGHAARKWRWRGVYTKRYTYVQHVSGERELYDRRSDPQELKNVANRKGYAVTQRRLASIYRTLRDCRGTECVYRRSP